MTHNRITDTAAMWVRDTLKQCAPTENVDWDIALQLVPTPQGSQLGFVLILRMPSPVLGQVITNMGLIPLDGASVQSIEQCVRGGVESIRAERSKALGAPATNGTGKIVLP